MSDLNEFGELVLPLKDRSISFSKTCTIHRMCTKDEYDRTGFKAPEHTIRHQMLREQAKEIKHMEIAHAEDIEKELAKHLLLLLNKITKNI